MADSLEVRALEEMARRLPRGLGLEVLESAASSLLPARTIGLALTLAEEAPETTFDRWCARLELADGGADGAPAEEIAELARRLEDRGALARLATLARAELARSESVAAALWLYTAELQRGDASAARHALERAASRLDASSPPSMRRQVAIEQLRDAPLRDADAPVPDWLVSAAREPRERFLVCRALLHQSRGGGRYVRVAALDALLELARALPPEEATHRDLLRACLRLGLAHVDALAASITELELDRVRALRAHVAPDLSLPPPLDEEAPRSPTELELRAREALRGLVRGEVPPADHPEHAAALALTALAHLIGGRDDAALSSIEKLSVLPGLPYASWAVVLHASLRPRTRRASATLAARAAAELPRPPFALTPLAAQVDPRAQRVLFLAARDASETGAAAALRGHVEAEALALRDQGQRPAAIALLEALERVLGPLGHREVEARATLLRARPLATGRRIP
jgi:hypothetical protein